MSVIRYRRTIHYSEQVAKLVQIEDNTKKTCLFLLLRCSLTYQKLVIISFFSDRKTCISFPGTRTSCYIPRQRRLWHRSSCPALLLKPFERLGVPVGEQVFDFVVGQGASRFLPEHGQSALRVVAAYHLAVEPHPARAALGTRAAGVTAAEELVAREQFGGDFPCVRLYLLAERCRRAVPRARYVPVPFPIRPSWLHRRCASSSPRN